MSVTVSVPRPALLTALIAGLSLILLGGCTTPAQERTQAELSALNAQRMNSPLAATQPYLGGYSPSDPPRLSADSGYDPLNPELSETVAIPFLSFLIIEPDPIPKNAVPPDVERLVKARQFQDAVNLINQQLKANPRNVQIRFVKARLQIEMRKFDDAKKTLVEITQQFPELPEPYNNLAAIAANQGNWIEARDYLELALKLRPTYAIAAANLGEIYIRLGAQAYENAAKGAQTNQRQYTLRAKALLDVLKPPARRPAGNTPVRPASTNDANRNTTSPTNLPESRPNNGESTVKN
ncbi:tetratricopeptide repeat protein [Polynucleobacter sp. 15G-AUS-farblos]|uniref:tetratricopeptide repeat protein n=1 Tax=Polynucleobacter sp. 15G-AUS-farblos TaxID=2689094 RepID=UPI001C0DD19C|nr:tetratricopeptide repeat protein [Polynucleobacter sp. 15G-AUS-farblos]MBU3584344.1 tetratricopeptide repeat protein [Polynucleobacter sp. 15G-AUS-farblos]